MSVNEAVERMRLRNVDAAEAARGELSCVQTSDQRNPADTLRERATQDAAHHAKHAAHDMKWIKSEMDTDDSSTDSCDDYSSTDTCDEGEDGAPLDDDITTNSVREHTHQGTTDVTQTGAEKMTVGQNCDKARFDSLEDAEER